jgi:hypothetical protein
LFFNTSEIPSAEGVQQGDPLGPLLFSLAIADTIAALSTQEPSLAANWWYLDDGFLAGDAETVKRAVDALTLRAKDIGLHLNMNKCELIYFDDAPPPCFTDVPCKLLHRDFDLLGTPIGSDKFVEDYIERKVTSKLQETVRTISSFDDPQVAYTILRACASFSPLVHIMRTVPPHQLLSSVRAVDGIVASGLSRIAGRQLLPQSICQASLGVACGGLGLRRTTDHVHAAFLSGCHQAANLDAWDLMADKAYVTALDTFESLFRGSTVTPDLAQKDLSEIVELSLRDELRAATLSLYDQGRLRSVASSDAGAFWNVVPSKQLGVALPPAHFRIILLWWLGEPIFLSDHPCPKCKATCCDQQGYHALVCRHGGNLGVRHNALRDVIFKYAQRSAMGPRVEQRVTPGSNRRHADILLPSSGHGVVCDVAVTHPLQPAYIAATTSGSGSAADAYGSWHKARKFSAAVEAEGYLYAPCVVDAFGNWSASGRATLELIASAASARDGIARGVHFRRLLARCSVSLMLSNARALLQREDPGTYLDDLPMSDEERGESGDEFLAEPHNTVAGSSADDDERDRPSA